MKVYRIPPDSSAILFDMDSTLYTNEDYMRTQIEKPLRRLAELRGLTPDAMKGEIENYRKAWTETHGGSISLTTTFRAFGVSLEESVRWREELYEPERFLKPDPLLREALEALRPSFRFALVTNNPVAVARRTLAALAVEDFFPVIVGLDSCLVSKPHPAPFLRAAELLEAPPGQCVSVGDRYDFDLAPPLELGMGAILVEGVADVYRLKPALLRTGSA
ncbi:MAG: HAD family hydrolase [Spirochaetaceae bacterium]|jgi:phosphoglycolate phosphatase/putative hydrolase of the HAD superfamily|nr:HAD family hydrolase [Spirochaetaceae bacterium]